MPKRRSTIPIAHADPDDVPTIAFTDEKWQAIECEYGRKLNDDVRQQVTTVTKQYIKDCIFDRTAAPKEMARKRIQRIRRAAGDLEKEMLDRELFSASTDELSREQQQQQQSAHSYADRLIADRLILPLPLPSDERGRTDELMGYVAEVIRQQLDEHQAPNGKTRRRNRAYELSKQQSDEHSWTDGLIRRHLDEQSLARHKLHHFPHALVVACDGALNDLSAARGYPGEAWGWWIRGLTQIAQEHSLPAGVSTELDRNGRPLPFVRLVQELERYLPADARSRTRSPAALAMAISRARNT